MVCLKSTRSSKMRWAKKFCGRLCLTCVLCVPYSYWEGHFSRRVTSYTIFREHASYTLIQEGFTSHVSCTITVPCKHCVPADRCKTKATPNDPWEDNVSRYLPVLYQTFLSIPSKKIKNLPLDETIGCVWLAVLCLARINGKFQNI